MRTSRSHILMTLAGAAAVVGLAACVPSADGDKKTIDTLDSLPVSTLPTTSTTIVSDAVIITAGTVVQPTSPPTLVPPTDATDESPTTTVVTATTSGATTTTSATGPGTYTIVAKDTLYGIAKKCSIGPAELAAYNDWTDGVNHLIIAGQKIKMPCVPKATDSTATTVAGSSATSTTAAGSSTGTSTTVASGPGGTYTVQAGDFLSGIAAKTGTTVDAIVKANGWTDGSSHAIFPGQVIKMPVKS